jgi:hypothetical protein
MCRHAESVVLVGRTQHVASVTSVTMNYKPFPALLVDLESDDPATKERAWSDSTSTGPDAANATVL